MSNVFFHCTAADVDTCEQDLSRLMLVSVEDQRDTSSPLSADSSSPSPVFLPSPQHHSSSSSACSLSSSSSGSDIVRPKNIITVFFVFLTRPRSIHRDHWWLSFISPGVGLSTEQQRYFSASPLCPGLGPFGNPDGCWPQGRTPGLHPRHASGQFVFIAFERSRNSMNPSKRFLHSDRTIGSLFSFRRPWFNSEVKHYLCSHSTLFFPLPRCRCPSQTTWTSPRCQSASSTTRICLRSALCATSLKRHKSLSTLMARAPSPARCTTCTTLRSGGSRATRSPWEPTPTAPSSRTKSASSTTRASASEPRTTLKVTRVPSGASSPRARTQHQVSRASSSTPETPGGAGGGTASLLTTRAGERPGGSQLGRRRPFYGLTQPSVEKLWMIWYARFF